MSKQECLDAQRVVSETYDGASVEPAEIQRARTHCEECEECAAFVSTLAVIRRIPAPSAPQSAVETALAAVRQQKEADDEATARDAAKTSEEDASSPTQVTDGTPPVSPLRGPWPKWTAYAGWAAAAAAVLLVAGIVTIQGVLFIVGGGSAEDGGRVLTESAPQASQNREMMGDVAGIDSPASAAKYVTVDGWVYEYSGPSHALRSNLTTHSTTLTSLDTEDAPRTLTVYTSTRPGIVLIDDDGELMEFTLVTRSMQGGTYAMKSRAITAYGQWPALPDGMPEPASPDGFPEFEPLGVNSDGVETYVPRGSSGQGGFAIPPGTDPSDPAAGNPNWTWWAPID